MRRIIRRVQCAVWTVRYELAASITLAQAIRNAIVAGHAAEQFWLRLADACADEKGWSLLRDLAAQERGDGPGFLEALELAIEAENSAILHYDASATTSTSDASTFFEHIGK